MREPYAVFEDTADNPYPPNIRILREAGCLDRGCTLRTEQYDDEPFVAFIHNSKQGGEAVREFTRDEYFRIIGTPEGHKLCIAWLRSVHEYEDLRKEGMMADSFRCPRCNSTDWITDRHHKERLCRHCGHLWKPDEPVQP